MAGRNQDRIAIISVWHGPGHGAERVLEHLLEESASTYRDRILVVAPKLSGVYAKADSLGYSLLEWPAKAPSCFRHDAIASLRLLPTLRRCQIGAIHSWHTRSFEWAALLARLINVPLLGTLHDHPQARGYGRLRQRLMRWGCHRMDQLACVSQALISVCDELRWTVPTVVIRNGLPDASLSPRTHRAPLRVAFLGCSEAWKGVDLLIETSQKLNADTFVWNLYGSIGPASSRKLASPVDLPVNIHWHGPRPPEEIYANNDIVFHPSTLFDPYPTVLLEAARGGLPVVASNVGGTPEIVLDEQTGFLVESGNSLMAADRLKLLAGDGQLWNNQSLAARERFEKHLRVESMLKSYSEMWAPYLS